MLQPEPQENQQSCNKVNVFKPVYLRIFHFFCQIAVERNSCKDTSACFIAGYYEQLQRTTTAVLMMYFIF